jgi:ADP-ribosylglycohydrolase
LDEQITKTLLYDKTLACLVAGLVGDAVGTPTEALEYEEIEKRFGWVTDFNDDGTDDTIMRNLLVEALRRTDGWATLDDWANVWIDRWDDIFGLKVAKFFQSVLHTAAKLKMYCVPREAALGNMPSSSSAMCIAPVGIVNAARPRQAAIQAYNLAGLIHIHDVGFCQDGAAAVAAAVSAAFDAEATTDTVIAAALAAIMPTSGKDMIERINRLQDVAVASHDYKSFRRTVYEQREIHFEAISCDSRETVPLTLALLRVADADVEQTILYSANFGRDADTIAAMGGSIAGALRGLDGIPTGWKDKALQVASEDQASLALDLVRTAQKKFAEMEASAVRFAKLTRGRSG